MNLALTVSTKSNCKRLKVGAVIVDENKRLVSTGYNGTPVGACNDCEENNKTKTTVIHAEENAILFAKQDLQGCILYCTTSPCLHCAAKIIQSGISKVYFLNQYRNGKGIDYLRHNGIPTKQML